MQNFRPGKLTLGVKFCIESEFQVKNHQCLQPEGKNNKKQKNQKDLLFTMFFLFLLFFIGSWGYAQNLIPVHLILVDLFGFLVMNRFRSHRFTKACKGPHEPPSLSSQ